MYNINIYNKPINQKYKDLIISITGNFSAINKIPMKINLGNDNFITISDYKINPCDVIYNNLIIELNSICK